MIHDCSVSAFFSRQQIKQIIFFRQRNVVGRHSSESPKGVSAYAEKVDINAFIFSGCLCEIWSLHKINKHFSIKTDASIPNKQTNSILHSSWNETHSDIWFKCFPNTISVLRDREIHIQWSIRPIDQFDSNRRAAVIYYSVPTLLIGAMSQKDQNSSQTSSQTPGHSSQDNRYCPMNTEKSAYATKTQENGQKSCLRKSLDAKQIDRRVKFSSPISREQHYFIFTSANSFRRRLHPPTTHPCMVYMGTRLQQERQRQQSLQQPGGSHSTTTKEVKWSARTLGAKSIFPNWILFIFNS